MWARVKLHPDCHLQFEKTCYSAPFALVRQHLWLRTHETTVQLLACVARRGAGEGPAGEARHRHAQGGEGDAARLHPVAGQRQHRPGGAGGDRGRDEDIATSAQPAEARCVAAMPTNQLRTSFMPTASMRWERWPGDREPVRDLVDTPHPSYRRCGSVTVCRSRGVLRLTPSAVGSRPGSSHHPRSLLPSVRTFTGRTNAYADHWPTPAQKHQEKAGRKSSIRAGQTDQNVVQSIG